MPSGGKPCHSGSQYSKQEKETCDEGKDLVKVVWFAEAVERLHQNSPSMSIGAGNPTLPRLRMSNTERDAKDFKWHHGQSYVWGVSIMDLHERKTTQLTGYLWPRCDGCVGRSSSGSLAKLGRYPSSLRPHLFGFSRLPGDGDIHPQHRGGREDEAASISASGKHDVPALSRGI